MGCVGARAHGARALGGGILLWTAPRLRLRRRAGAGGAAQKAIPIALLTFNVGVELGQLIFVAAVLLLGLAWRRLPLPQRAWMPYLAPYAIGAVAMFWVVDRVAAFWA